MPRNSAAGDRFNFAIFLGGDGFWTGKTFSRPAAGTGTNGGSLRLYGAKQAAPTTPTPAPVVVTGEDGFVRHEYPFPADASRGFEIQLAEQDLVTAMQVQNMPTKSYAGGLWGYEDVADVLLPNVSLIIQSWAIDSETGVKKWSGVFIPAASLAWLGRDTFNERTGAIFRYFATPQPSAYDAPGYTIFDSDGAPKNAVMQPFQNFAYPLTMHAFSPNGVATVYATDLQPVSTSGVEASSERVSRSLASVQTTSPYGVTFASAPPAGRGHIIYQFKG